MKKINKLSRNPLNPKNAFIDPRTRRTEGESNGINSFNFQNKVEKNFQKSSVLFPTDELMHSGWNVEKSYILIKTSSQMTLLIVTVNNQDGISNQNEYNQAEDIMSMRPQQPTNHSIFA